MQVRSIPRLHRTIAFTLLPLQLFTGPVMPLIAADCSNVPVDAPVLPVIQQIASTIAKRPYQPVPKQNIAPVEKGITVAPPVKFSPEPLVDEVRATRLFPEPLVPLGGQPVPADTKALAQALESFASNPSPDRVGMLETYLHNAPTSPWRVSLLTNLGLLSRQGGYWSKALLYWSEAWELGKNHREGAAIVDRAFAGRAELLARLGRVDALTEFLAQAGGRDFCGSALEKVSQAKASLHLMHIEPTKSFRCGPFAAGRVFAALNPEAPLPQLILDSTCSAQGTSLTQVREFAKELGLDLQVARRSPGAEIPTPCVIHWQAGHYAALTRTIGEGKYVMEDPTFSERMSISAQAIEEEASGFFLIAADNLPPGWTTVAEEEAAKIWGRGAVPPGSDTTPPETDESEDDFSDDSDYDSDEGDLDDGSDGCGGEKGMAYYTVDKARVGLRITDTPIAYSLPRGGGMRCTVDYNQRESAGFTQQYSNLGPQWNLRWIAYVVDDPSNVSAKTYGPGGGILKYEGFNATTQSYTPQQLTQVVLQRTSSTSYVRKLPDGSKQYFTLSDGGSPAKIFLTSEVDTTGNTTTYNYDCGFRLTSVVDPMGQPFLLTYLSNNVADTANYYRVKTISSLGRTATFAYDGSNRLWRITDPVGIVSEFTYGVDNLISALTTPYGTTKFVSTDTGSDRRLDITDALGATKRFEFRYADATAVPDAGASLPSGSGFLATTSYWQYRNTYYWSKKAFAEDPVNTAKAKVYHWLHVNSSGNLETTGILESVKKPLMGRVFYNYQGQTNSTVAGTSNRVTAIGRVMDNGTSQIEKREYNTLGHITKLVTPSDVNTPARIKVFTYSGDDVALMATYQFRSGGGWMIQGQPADRIFSQNLNGSYQPTLVTDAAGQSTAYSYNSYGQILTMTNAKSETYTFTYDRDDNSDGVSDGYLKWIDGPVANSRCVFAYDGFGRLSSVVNLDGDVTSFEYEMINGDSTKTLDRVVAINYADGTVYEIGYFRLERQWVKDRAGRITQYFHNPLRQLETMRNALGQDTRFRWCKCGSLSELSDPSGNITKWERDTQGRVVNKIYSDQTSVLFNYQPKSGRLATMTDARGQITNYTYRIDGKLSGVSYVNAIVATPGVGYTYDSAYGRMATMTDGIGTTNYTYNAIAVPPMIGAGRLASIDGPWVDDTITYDYDELGRVIARQINGAANPAGVTYDSLGRVRVRTTLQGTTTFAYSGQTVRLDYVDLPNAQRICYDYYPAIAAAATGNGAHRLKQIRNLGVGANGSGSVLSQFDYSYGLSGQITNWQQLLGGTIRNWSVSSDSIGQLTGVIVKDGVGGILADHQYRYDLSGNRILAQKDQNPLKSTYNALNQLISKQGGGLFGISGTLSEGGSIEIAGNSVPVATDHNFAAVVPIVPGANIISLKAKDAVGNETNKTITVTGVAGAVQTPSYDLNGNLTLWNNPTNPAENQSYEWDACDRLVAIVRGINRTEFTYDGSDLRRTQIEKVNGMVVASTRLIWDGLMLVEERDALSNQVLKRYFGFGMQLLGGPNAGHYFYAKDHLGSVREMIDAVGTVRARYDYDPYGQVSKLSGDLDSDQRFTGHFYHQIASLHLAPYRAYSADIGRWLSRDPIKENGGVNLYGYVKGSPLTLIDPLGLEDEWYRGGASAEAGTGGMGTWEGEAFAKRAAELPAEVIQDVSQDLFLSYIGGKISQAVYSQALKCLKARRATLASKLPSNRADIHVDLRSKGFNYKSTSKNGYVTYKHPDGRVVTIKPTGEVIPTSPAVDPTGKKYNQRTDYEGNRLPDQSHSTGHFVK